MYSRVPAWHPEMVFGFTISQSILFSHGSRLESNPDKNRDSEIGVSCVVVVPRRRYSATELVLSKVRSQQSDRMYNTPATTKERKTPKKQ